MSASSIKIAYCTRWLDFSIRPEKFDMGSLDDDENANLHFFIVHPMSQILSSNLGTESIEIIQIS